MTNIKRWGYLIYLIIVYKVFYIEDNKCNGWFMKKNPITMIIIAPLLIPFFMMFGVLIYWDWVTNYNFKWIEGEKRKLTLKEKIIIKYTLIK